MTPRADDPVQSFVTGAWLYYFGIAIVGAVLTIMGGRRA